MSDQDYNGATDEHCPNMFWHVWTRDPWPLPQGEYCKWCGRPKPEK